MTVFMLSVMEHAMSALTLSTMGERLFAVVSHDTGRLCFNGAILVTFLFKVVSNLINGSSVLLLPIMVTCLIHLSVNVTGTFVFLLSIMK